MTLQQKPITAPRMAARTATILFIFVTVFTAILSGAYLWTLPAIEAAAEEEKMKLIDEVLPRSRYDNELLEDYAVIDAAAGLGLDEPARIFRARQDGRIEAVVFEAVAPDGYSGKIRLLLALGADGRVAGVRVIQHKETPGLGDYIDPQKDPDKVHPWISQFNGLAPATAGEREWKVKKDGGRFDFMTGATVSPRAVIKAVRKAALFVEENREKIFSSKPQVESRKEMP